MKRILFLLSLSIFSQLIKAQTTSVGIGTAAPNASAMLDVTSPLNNKGVLLPRMTAAQRIAIPGPATGLMVYETTTSSLWVFNGIVWVQQSSGGASPWTITGTNIYNTNTGNVGVGNNTPASKLHVQGNLLLDNTNPTIQFKHEGVDKVFVQSSSGSNLRMGTYSGNGAGKLVIRMNGTDRVVVDSIGQMGIGTTTPNEKLDVEGKIRITAGGNPFTQPGIMLYANPYNEFDPVGPSNISFYNWANDGNGGYDYASKYQLKFEGGVSERLKLQHVDHEDQLVLSKTGNVGIGTIGPAEKLEVNGNLLIENATPLLKIKKTSLLASAVMGIEFNSNTNSNLAKISYTDGGLVFSGDGNTGILKQVVIKDGNLGVGTGSPQERLQVTGNALFNYLDPTIRLQQLGVEKGFVQLADDDLRVGTYSSNTAGKFIVRTGGADNVFVTNSGNVGIDVPSPIAKLQIMNGSDVSISSHGYLMLGSVTGSNLIFDNNEIMARSAGTVGNLVLQNDGGTVRIGSTAVPSGYKFAINGKMICEELKVKLASSGWPDYVFDKKYKLPSLTQVEKFIQQNKHLPNIPSAAEVEKNGIEVGDMQKRMMEKIEELTLYIIELKKDIELLKLNK